MALRDIEEGEELFVDYCETMREKVCVCVCLLLYVFMCVWHVCVCVTPQICACMYVCMYVCMYAKDGGEQFVDYCETIREKVCVCAYVYYYMYLYVCGMCVCV